MCCGLPGLRALAEGERLSDWVLQRLAGATAGGARSDKCGWAPVD
jgi:hypothetical protein